MLRFASAIVGLLATVAAAQAQLAFQDIQACEGAVGPQRATLTFHHLDRVCFRFVVAGASADAEGLANVHITTNLTAPDGSNVGNAESPWDGLMQFGPIFADTVSFRLPERLVPGEYTLQVAAKDGRTNQTVSFERKLVLQPDEFAICSPEFFYDAEGEVPAPFGGLVGQRLQFQFNVIGIGNTAGRTEIETRFEVLDAKTRALVGKPITKVDQTANPLLAQSVVRLASLIVLSRPGDFILRVSATDRLTHKTAQREVPLHVTAP